MSESEKKELDLSSVSSDLLYWSLSDNGKSLTTSSHRASSVLFYSKSAKIAFLLMQFISTLNSECLSELDISHLRKLRIKARKFALESEKVWRSSSFSFFRRLFEHCSGDSDYFSGFVFDIDAVEKKLDDLESSLRAHQIHRLQQLISELDLAPFIVKEFAVRIGTGSSDLSTQELMENLSCSSRKKLISRFLALQFLEKVSGDDCDLRSFSVSEWQELFSTANWGIMAVVDRFRELCSLNEQILLNEVRKLYQKYLSEQQYIDWKGFIFSASGLGKIIDCELLEKDRLEQKILQLSFEVGLLKEDVDQICQDRYVSSLDTLAPHLCYEFKSWLDKCAVMLNCINKKTLSDLESYCRDMWDEDLLLLSDDKLGHYLALMTVEPRLLELAHLCGYAKSDLKEQMRIFYSDDEVRFWSFDQYQRFLRWYEAMYCSWLEGKRCNLSREQFQVAAIYQGSCAHLVQVTVDQWKSIQDLMVFWRGITSSWASFSYTRGSIEDLLELRYGFHEFYKLHDKELDDFVLWSSSLQKLEELRSETNVGIEELRQLSQERYGSLGRELSCLRHLSGMECNDLYQWCSFAPKIKDLSELCGHKREELDEVIRIWDESRGGEGASFRLLPGNKIPHFYEWYFELSLLFDALLTHLDGQEAFAKLIGYSGTQYTPEILLQYYSQDTYGLSLYAISKEEFPKNLWWGSKKGSEKPLWAKQW